MCNGWYICVVVVYICVVAVDHVFSPVFHVQVFTVYLLRTRDSKIYEVYNFNERGFYHGK